MKYTTFYIYDFCEYDSKLTLTNVPPLMRPFDNDFQDEDYKEISIFCDDYYDEDAEEYDDDAVRSAAEKAVKDLYGDAYTLEW